LDVYDAHIYTTELARAANARRLRDADFGLRVDEGDAVFSPFKSVTRILHPAIDVCSSVLTGGLRSY